MTAEYRDQVSVDDLPEPDCSYPVLVVEHKEHVAWIQADSAAEALQLLKDDGEWYEHISDQQTLTSFWKDMSSPDKWDWNTVYRSGETYPGMQADAHVQIHKAVKFAEARAAEKAACAAAGHPQVQFYKGDTPRCSSCGYLTAEQLVADIRAATQAGQVTA